MNRKIDREIDRDRETDRGMDMTKLIDAFRHYAYAPNTPREIQNKNVISGLTNVPAVQVADAASRNVQVYRVGEGTAAHANVTAWRIVG